MALRKVIMIAGLTVAPVSAPSQNVGDSRVAAFQAAQAAEVAALRTAAADPTRDPGSRVADLKKLALINEQEALSVAARLISDSDDAVAVHAVEVLFTSVALLGHHSHGASSSPWAAAVDAQRRLVETALQAAASDTRPLVAKPALKGLASLSHASILTRIPQAIRSDLITEPEAANACGLAQPDLARACLIDLLESPTPAAKKAAVTALAARAADRAMIRNKVLFNNKASVVLRIAAADSLARYDRSFATYGSLLTADPATPPGLFATVLRAQASHMELSGGLDAAQRSQLLRVIDNKINDVRQHTPRQNIGAVIEPLVDLRGELTTR
ncbi:hypothetical protein [Sphingomonas sp.]|jgi:hypothetical protein|uniref:hypothetical protein n=1 Tax=Sphingomonas sp. TaxID=28214 RepID=UPI00184D9E4C|nr:hypothetical protein [Sphingomonas sp.]MBA3512311.1 hypothetical protein [Sphingomonas sp.]